MPDFSEQSMEYKYNPKYVTSDNYNTKLTVLKSFSKDVAGELFRAGFPVYSIVDGRECLIDDVSELKAHTGEFCTEKEFSNIIGSKNSKDGLVGRIDLTVMGVNRKEEQQTLLYFDLNSFMRDIRKARDLGVPIEVQYIDAAHTSDVTQQNKQTKPKNHER